MNHTHSLDRGIEARSGLLCTVPCLQWMQVANGSQRLSLKVHRLPSGLVSVEQSDQHLQLQVGGRGCRSRQGSWQSSV